MRGPGNEWNSQAMAIVGFGNYQETGAMTAPASFSLLVYSFNRFILLKGVGRRVPPGDQ